jgi:WD40 repeat protein
MPWWRYAATSSPTAVRAVAFSPDGKTLAVSYGNTVSMWSVEGNKASRQRKWMLPGPVQGVTFTPDGRHLITANANGTAYILRLADARDGFRSRLAPFWSWSTCKG